MENLIISGTIEQTLTNGEGLRAVVFFSGCTHNCEGCHNKELQKKSKDKDLDINEVIKNIEDNSDYLDGVTLSGGEPFQQDLYGLNKFIKNVKKKNNLNVWIYTGYTLEQLLSEDLFPNEEIVISILQEIDVLVDGKYNSKFKDNEPKSYRGSTNQRILNKKDIQEVIRKRGGRENERVW